MCTELAGCPICASLRDGGEFCNKCNFLVYHELPICTACESDLVQPGEKWCDSCQKDISQCPMCNIAIPSHRIQEIYMPDDYHGETKMCTDCAYRLHGKRCGKGCTLCKIKICTRCKISIAENEDGTLCSICVYNSNKNISTTNTDNYWLGPYDVLVPNHINSVVDGDQCNTLYKNGSMTRMCCPYPNLISKESYLKKYAIYNESDNKWYYNEPIINIVYVLKLSNDKYYVGKTNKIPEERFMEHVNGHGSEWTRLYKPLLIIKVIENIDKYDEDKITKKYMDKYGIDNVRGGSYTSVQLLDYQIKALQLELCTYNDKCYKCQKQGHFADQCTQQNDSYLNQIGNTKLSDVGNYLWQFFFELFPTKNYTNKYRKRIMLMDII